SVPPRPPARARCASRARHRYSGILHDPGHGDNLSVANDDRPGVALCPRYLRVDEDVLQLLAPAGQAVAGATGADLQPGGVRLDRPRAPADRAALEREAAVLAGRAQAAAEVGRLRAVAIGEEREERVL